MNRLRTLARARGGSCLPLAAFMLGCSAPASPARAPEPAASRASQPQKAAEHTQAEPPTSEGPLTLLADPPAAKAQPAEPVSQRGWLGVALGPAKNGVVIDRVVPGSPAERFGLTEGAVIHKVDGQAVYQPGDVVRIVAEHAAGERLPMVFSENGQQRLVAVELAGRPVDRDITRMSYVGQPAPELGLLSTVKGSVTPTLQALRGKVVVLEFWASWCGVCRFMVPTMNEWQSRFGPQGAVVLGVTVDPVSVAASTASQLGMEYPLASDGDGEATRAYSANALPTLFIIDQKGLVREVIIGYSEGELAAAETLIEKLLSGS